MVTCEKGMDAQEEQKMPSFIKEPGEIWLDSHVNFYSMLEMQGQQCTRKWVCGGFLHGQIGRPMKRDAVESKDDATGDWEQVVYCM